MSEHLSFEKVCGSENSHFDLIFVHGLTGSPKETWAANGDASKFWPLWFCEDLPNLSVYTLGYPASVFGKWAKKEMNLFECAKAALEHMASYQIGSSPIAFVTHSLGGLLTKQMLRTANENADDGWRAISDHTRLVAFLATPHTGISLGGILKTFAKAFTSAYASALVSDSGQLDELNEAYRQYAPKASIKTLPYYEKYKTNGILLVDRHSADPGVHRSPTVPIEADHITICKPQDRDSAIYRSLKRHLQNAMVICAAERSSAAKKTDASSIILPDDYTKTSENDRRDLLQKLIDAGREDEFESANDDQNKFAQRYYRLGLHSEAKTKHDELLADIEQRFKLHVFQNKICKKANDDEVLQSIQSDVIDPICQKYGPNASPAIVLRAIYFLTEQCHLRWDAP